MPSRLLALVVACTLGFIAIPAGAVASPVYGSDGGGFSGWFGHDLVLGNPPGGTPFALWFSFGAPAPGPDTGAGDTLGAPGAPGTPGQQDPDPQGSSSSVVYTNVSSGSVFETTTGTIGIVTLAPAVPETSTWAMMLIGLATLGIVARRRRSLAAIA